MQLKTKSIKIENTRNELKHEVNSDVNGIEKKPHKHLLSFIALKSAEKTSKRFSRNHHVFVYSNSKLYDESAGLHQPFPLALLETQIQRQVFIMYKLSSNIAISFYCFYLFQLVFITKIYIII